MVNRDIQIGDTLYSFTDDRFGHSTISRKVVEITKQSYVLDNGAKVGICNLKTKGNYSTQYYTETQVSEEIERRDLLSEFYLMDWYIKYLDRATLRTVVEKLNQISKRMG